MNPLGGVRASLAGWAVVAALLLPACSASDVTIHGTFFRPCSVGSLRILDETGDQVALAEIAETTAPDPETCLYDGTFEVVVPKRTAYEVQAISTVPVVIALPTITFEELERREFKWDLTAIPT